MKLKPNAKQLSFLDWEFGIFFHFGIRSFYPGHHDWDGKPMDAKAFNPTNLDCHQWVKMAKDAGATYAIMTTKHHDGFALWPTAYSSYSVTSAPWKNGKGDVVKEFTDACREAGLKVGLYYSPAQWGEAAPLKDPKAYDDYFIHQIEELLGHYGKIDYLWFDGCGSEGHEYDKARIVKRIFELQPDILTFCDPDWAPGVCWVGNEDGFAALDNPYVRNKWDFSIESKAPVLLEKESFLPSECDCKLRSTWFHDNNENTIKDLDTLFGMYEMSVGHGANLLLDVGPDEHGLIPEADYNRVQELGEKIRHVYGKPNDYGPVTKEADGTYTITNPDFYVKDIEQDPTVGLTNRVVIQEDLTNGVGVKSFKLYAYLPYYRFKKILVYEGEGIGHKLICPIGAIRSPRFELEITSQDGDVSIRDMKAYYCD